MTGGISDDKLCILVFVSLFLFQDMAVANVNSVSTLAVTVTMLGTLLFFFGIGVHDSMNIGNHLLQNVMAQTQNFASSTMKSIKILICKILDSLVEEGLSLL